MSATCKASNPFGELWSCIVKSDTKWSPGFLTCAGYLGMYLKTLLLTLPTLIVACENMVFCILKEKEIWGSRLFHQM
ncbi:hypothetical protein CW304_21970 [Bacillus sp. UFRGS-B20]|nr:hypothetical protein CW304_21970 [Bacillus sp. UFRGS-B20]